MLVFNGILFGTTNHLARDDSGFRWIDDVPGNAFVYGGKHKYSAAEWLAMHDEKPPPLIEKKYVQMAKELGYARPKWQKLLGKKFKDNLVVAQENLEQKLLQTKNTKYEPVWRECQDFIWSMKPVKINRVRYASLKAMNVKLPGFNPVTGSLDPVRYDRKTKTGRLRVVSGPSVLTIKSEHRNMVQGCRQIDFKNMEPRLLLAFLGREVEGDLYENIQKDLNIKGDRSYVKVSIISSLYGSRVVPEISKYFALKEWIAELEKEVKNNILENYFGRPIQTNGVTGHHLLSLWLQSSAADAALLAFSKFFRANPSLKPHWIIHDACIFSGEGNIPEYLYIDDNIRLPIECTDIK
tara:strand:+ start:1361 stop:2416 length:1056 start_codon:yes stop_codon:yes gene_type:complete